MGLKDRVRRALRVSREDDIVIPQQDGSIRRFPRSAYKDAFLNAIERLGAKEDAPPRHPMLDAAKNSSDRKWREFYFGDLDYPGATEPIEDLSCKEDM
jgi:hypothetical protein